MGELINDLLAGERRVGAAPCALVPPIVDGSCENLSQRRRGGKRGTRAKPGTHPHAVQHNYTTGNVRGATPIPEPFAWPARQTRSGRESRAEQRNAEKPLAALLPL